MKVHIEFLSGQEQTLNIYINEKRHDFYGYRARDEGNQGIWEDGNTKEEALGKLIIKLFKV